MTILQLLYQKLLICYPRAFRDEFTAAMLQTVDDLCRAQRSQSLWGKVKFAAWLLTDTIIAIVHEHLAAAREGVRMKMRLADIRSSIIFSVVLTLPLVLLELIHKPGDKGAAFQFPYALFVVLWSAPLLFMLTLLPIVRTLRSGETALANPLLLLLRVTLLLFMAAIWLGLMSDQLPCFIGVPNCD